MSKPKNYLHKEMVFRIKVVELPTPEEEYRFAAHRVGLGPGIKKRLAEARLKDWRFDFAWPKLPLPSRSKVERGPRGVTHGGAGFSATVSNITKLLLCGGEF